jgi:hypothetical protein
MAVCGGLWRLHDRTTVDALMTLYHTTDGSRWLNSHNWMNGDPCQDLWWGVGCDAANTTVIELYAYLPLPPPPRR